MILSMNCSHSWAPHTAHTGLFLWIFLPTTEASNKWSFHFLRRELEGKKYTYIRVLVWIHFWSASPDLACLGWHCGVNSQCLNCFWVFFQHNDDVFSGNKLKGWSIQLRRPDKNYSPWNMHCVGIRSSHLFSLSAWYFWTILITLLLG